MGLRFYIQIHRVCQATTNHTLMLRQRHPGDKLHKIISHREVTRSTSPRMYAVYNIHPHTESFTHKLWPCRVSVPSTNYVWGLMRMWVRTRLVGRSVVRKRKLQGRRSLTSGGCGASWNGRKWTDCGKKRTRNGRGRYDTITNRPNSGASSPGKIRFRFASCAWRFLFYFHYKLLI